MNQATRSALLGAAAALAALPPGAASAQYYYGYGQSWGNQGFGTVRGPNGSYGRYDTQTFGNQTFTNYRYNDSNGYQQRIRCNTQYIGNQAYTTCR